CGVGWGSYTFAMPTMADPDLSEQMAAADQALRALMGNRLYYQDYCKRNLQDALTQLLTIARDAVNPPGTPNAGQPRYRSKAGHGLIAGFSIDSEIKMPSHWIQNNPSKTIPRHSDYGGGLVSRPFVEDYHPVMIRQFQEHLIDKYGDSAPNADSNNDGKTFENDYASDYVSSGWVDLAQTPPINHPHYQSDLNDWYRIDPPRKYPDSGSAPRSRYWHEWCNFRAGVVDQTIENYLSWWIEAGVPPTRLFNHQSPVFSSVYENRCHEPHNKEFMDEWRTIEVSGGYSGINKYGLKDFNVDAHLFKQLHRRDDGWASPEWCPNIPSNGVDYPSASELEAILLASWQTRGHCMHYHAWSKPQYKPYDSWSNHWDRDADSSGLIGWSNYNLIPSSSGYLKRANPNLDGYLDVNTPLQVVDDGIPSDFLAEKHPFIVTQIHALLENEIDTLRVDFQKRNDPTWYTAAAQILHNDTKPAVHVVLNMKKASLDWNGVIDKLRLYPIPTPNASVYITALWCASQSTWTIEQQKLATHIQSIGRPPLPNDYQVVEGVQELAPPIPNLYASDPNLANLTVYGTEPWIDPSNGRAQFDDFSYINNFEPADVSLGGVRKLNSIRARPPSFLGNSKTGRFRRLRLPDTEDDLVLSFHLGLDEPDLVADDDGVRFSIQVRRQDGTRELTEVFSEEWRDVGWSPAHHVYLNAFKGEVVDIHFKTHSVADTHHDSAVWGRPVIYSAAPSADFALDSPVTIKVGESLSLYDASSNLPTSWLWEIVKDDFVVFSSSAQNPIFTFTEPGMYSVRLTATNPSGSGVKYEPNVVNVEAMWLASLDFLANTETVQGFRGWFYRSCGPGATPVYVDMDWDPTNNRWNDPAAVGICVVYKRSQYSANRDACRIWTAPVPGEIHITGDVNRANPGDVTVIYSVNHRDTGGAESHLWSAEFERDDTSKLTFDLSTYVEAGEQIIFRLTRTEPGGLNGVESNPKIKM
ncbi:MAG: PKD domain-containing protein, partial [Planctomycetota bacterium]